ncbi:hypothetical protein BC834DRAFT_973321 [Gloeopeniophorella convolvens]|nr:hypothetical protein BC834DRAFT_973321 [Gloeopeniophorella convolvens]
MSRITDVFSLIFTAAFALGVVLGLALLARKCSAAIDSTRASLEERGWKVSGSGVSVKTTRRLDREHYLDATQRGLMKVANASSFRARGDSSAASDDGGSSSESSRRLRLLSRHREGRSSRASLSSAE